VGGEEFGLVRAHQARRLQDVRRPVACQRAQGDPLEERHSGRDALCRVVPQVQLTSWDAQERVSEAQQAVLEQPRAALALLPQEKLARLQAVLVLRDAPQVRQARQQHWG
jgi:hypothetical protein